MNNPFDNEQPPQEPKEDFSPSPGAQVGAAVAEKSGGGIKGILRSAWRGEEKLWKVFWLYGVVAGIVFQILMGVLGGISAFIVLGFFVLVMLPYGVWNMVSLWRCAWNAGAKFWGIVVRILVVISIPGYVLTVIALVGAATLGTVAAVSGAGHTPVMQQSAPETPMTVPDAAPAAPVAPVSDPSVMAPAPAAAPAPGAAAPVAPAAAPVAAVPVTAPATPVVPAAPSAPAPDACEQKMHDFAVQNKADPAAYIAQNQAYLAQCRAVLAGQMQPKP